MSIFDSSSSGSDTDSPSQPSKPPRRFKRLRRNRKPSNSPSPPPHGSRIIHSTVFPATIHFSIPPEFLPSPQELEETCAAHIESFQACLAAWIDEQGQLWRFGTVRVPWAHNSLRQNAETDEKNHFEASSENFEPLTGERALMLRTLAAQIECVDLINNDSQGRSECDYSWHRTVLRLGGSIDIVWECKTTDAAVGDTLVVTDAGELSFDLYSPSLDLSIASYSNLDSHMEHNLDEFCHEILHLLVLPEEVFEDLKPVDVLRLLVFAGCQLEDTTDAALSCAIVASPDLAQSEPVFLSFLPHSEDFSAASRSRKRPKPGSDRRGDVESPSSS